MVRGEEYVTSVIRIFPDYSESVIWFGIGPVSYEQAKVSAQLRHDMGAWESFYYQACTDDFRWRSHDHRSRFAAEGHRLAACLAVELGDRFEVEFKNYRGEGARARSKDAPTNPQAAEAFSQIAREFGELKERIDREAQAGAGFGWFAYNGEDEPKEKQS